MLMVAATALFVGGCEDEPVKKPEVTVEPQPAKEVAPSGPLDKVAAPDSILVYGGIDKMTDMAGHLSELVLGSPTQGAVQLDSAVSALALRFGLKDGKALDIKKPIRFAVVDPKANDEPFCIAVGITSRADFAKALPEKHKKDEAGNAFTYDTPGMKTVFVNYVDDWAVFTGQKEVFGAHKPFLVKLIGSTVQGDASAVIDVAHVTKLFGSEMTSGLAELKKTAAAQNPSGSSMAGGMDKMFDWMKSMADDLDKVIITTTASKDAGRLQFDLLAKSGSELDKTFKSLGERKLDALMGRLPADAPAALVASFDPDSATDLMRGITAWSLQLTMGQSASEKDYSDAMNAYWKASNGDMALVAHQHEGELRLSMLAGVRDAKAATEAMDTLRGMYKEEGFKKLYEQMGLEYEFKKNAYKVGDVNVDSARAKLGKPKGDSKAPDLEQAMGPAAGMFNQMMSHDFAITKDSMIAVYGSDARKLMEPWIEGKVAGGLDKAPGMQRALKTAAPGLFFVLYGSPLAVAQAMQDKEAAPAAGNGIAVTAGSTGNVVHIVLDVPSDQARALTQMMGSLGPM